MAPDDRSRLVLLDTHVHYHPFCGVSEFFDCAWKNFQNAAATFEEDADFMGIVCLLETGDSSRFAEISGGAQGSSFWGQWRIDANFDGEFLVAEGAGAEKIYVVPGRQVVTIENLEVLIIGLLEGIPSEESLAFYLEKYSETHLVILPWGAGKWLGRRGLVLKETMHQLSYLEYVVGDSGVRPSFWQNVPQFEDAKQLGKHILFGSDPLPVAGQQRKVGSCGAGFYSNQVAEQLVLNLRSTILGLTTEEVSRYGELDGLFGFIYNQFLLRLNRVR